MVVMRNLAGIGLTLALAAAVPDAKAELFIASNGGGQCDTSDGGGGGNFYTGDLYMENVSSNAQYLVCSLPLVRESLLNIALGQTGYKLDMNFQNAGASSAKVFCVAQLAVEGSSKLTQTRSAKSIDIPVGSSGKLAWARTELVIRNAFAPLSINCLIPPGVRVRNIEQFMPETGVIAVPTLP